jgi:ribosomal protein S18 acetylase RimI-like enzyme
MNIEIFKFDSSHLRELTAWSLQTFKDAFEKGTDPKHFQKYIAQAFAPEIIYQELTHPQTVFYGLRVSGEFAGYWKLRWDRYADSDAPKPVLELQRIYFLEKYWNQGLGQQALRWIEAFAQQQHFKSLLLLVYSENHGARRFYFREGFIEIGRANFQFGDEIHNDFVMCKNM